VFLPKNLVFFDFFEEQLEVISKGVAILQGLKGRENIREDADEMKKVEHQGDVIAHRILETLNKTFITPIDREDITQLAHGLDDVLDDIERVVNRLSLYRLIPVPDVVFTFADNIGESVEELKKGICLVRDDRKRNLTLNSCERINALENEGDDLLRSNLEALLNSDKDPVFIIKMKEIIETLENVTDRCEDVADILENIVIKNY
jgi:predicted phosphate transport protein (TIGR00153 family)